MNELEHFPDWPPSFGHYQRLLLDISTLIHRNCQMDVELERLRRELEQVRGELDDANAHFEGVKALISEIMPKWAEACAPGVIAANFEKQAREAKADRDGANITLEHSLGANRILSAEIERLPKALKDGSES